MRKLDIEMMERLKRTAAAANAKPLPSLLPAGKPGTKLAQLSAASKRVSAGIASVQATKAAAERAMQTFGHEWIVDDDYDYDLARVAAKFANQHAIVLPWVSSRVRSHDERNTERFRFNEWTPLRVPGVYGLVQAKGQYGSVLFRSPSKGSLKKVQELIRKLEEEIDNEELDFEIDFDVTPSTSLLSWKDGRWDSRRTRNARTFRSVVLPKATQAAIEADLKAFTESKDRLTRLEMPWRRGYLLSGPPGTGKTSTALAVAGALHFNLAALALTAFKDDEELKNAVALLPAHTVLVIEDVDAYSVSRDRNHDTGQSGGLSLSGLLNSLDGFETPNGLVVIATTNHIEHLDAALIRPGRLDRTFTIDFIQGPELERLFRWFYEQDPPATAPDCSEAGLAPAEVNELFKQHLNDPEGGWGAVVQRITGTTPLAAVA